MSESVHDIPKKDDSFLALSILVVAIVGVISTVLYLWKVKKIFNPKEARFVAHIFQAYFPHLL